MWSAAEELLTIAPPPHPSMAILNNADIGPPHRMQAGARVTTFSFRPTPVRCSKLPHTKTNDPSAT